MPFPPVTARSRRGRATVAGLAALAAVLGGLAAAPPATAATTCASDRRDVFAGAPNLDGARGAVDIHQHGRDASVLTRSGLGLGTGAAGDRFGAALAHDRAANGCALLVIGAPGVHGRGAVYLAVDTPEGFEAVWSIEPGGGTGDRFGETVLLSRSMTDDPNRLELWVGAPRRDVGSATDAGGIERYRVDLVPGSDHVTVVHEQSLRQGAATMPGTSAEANDRFGEVLAGSERGIVVGVPHENVGSAVDAGMVTLVGWSSRTYRGLRNVTQATAGIPGAPESGDRFGAAVTPCAHVVGVPGEDVGSVRDAGMVQLLRGCDPDRLLPGAALSQGSRGIPGTDEAGDQFGAAVAEYSVFEDADSPVIGVPGEDIGGITNAGLIVGRYSGQDDWYSFRQGDGLAGSPEPGDAVGSALGVRHFYDLLEGGSAVHESTYPQVGAPGEDIGSVKDAGAAYSRGQTPAGDRALTTVTFGRGAVAGLRFGTVLAADTYGYPTIH